MVTHKFSVVSRVAQESADRTMVGSQKVTTTPILVNIACTFQDVRFRNARPFTKTTDTIQDRPIEFKLLVNDRKAITASDDTIDSLLEVIKDGSLIKLTHIRDARLQMWKEYSDNKTYIVSNIAQSDYDARCYVLALKTLND